AGGPASAPATATPSAESTIPDAVTTPAPTASASEPGGSAAEALGILAGLEAVSGYAPTDYDRDLFGQRWADVDRNGCDTRNDILGRDLLNPVFKAGTGDCKVLAGDLIDPYDGTATAFVSGQNTSVLVQVDHVVALGWAWEHGAWAWSDEQRTAFANDPDNLVAASQHTNQSKSASGPADWLPPEPALRCVYVEQWVGVLGAYALGIDERDRHAARAVLETC
ncbi:MAG TPA: HNH endonuclease family protein, partial [Microbacterium sp.]|nr:HNH endonuclease family protein [Microbacterium sp.]